MKILFVIPYMFVPPDSGNKNLMYGLLKYINTVAVCDLALLVDDDIYAPASIETTLREEFPGLGKILIFQKPIGTSRLVERLKVLAKMYHPSLGSYVSKSLCTWLSTNVRASSYDVIHFDMFHTAVYRRFVNGTPSVLIASDAYSMAAREARLLSSNLIVKAKLILEGWLLLNIEKREYPKFSMICTVSEKDARYLRSIAGTANIRTIGIGVAPEYSERAIKHFDCCPEVPTKILLTGSLNHSIVAQGVIDFLELSLPSIRQRHPAVCVTVLGKSPTSTLEEIIDSIPGVEHVSFVDDYAGFLDQDWVYVYPQYCATGLQTKVQQAMALGLPVVGYEVSFGGLSVESGTHCFICNSSNDMSNYVLSLLGDIELRREIGLSSARYVRENFSIKRIGSHMVLLYDETILLRNVD